MRLQAIRVTSRAAIRPLAPLAVCALLAMAAPRLYGQAPASPPDQQPAKNQPAKDQPAAAPKEARPKRLLIGVRVRGTPLRQFSIMSNRSEQRFTASPLHEFDYTTTSRSFPVGVGVLAELRLHKYLLFRVEAIHQGLKYDKTTNDFSGTARALTSTTERTNATSWEIPAMVQFRPSAQSGFLKNFYIAGGESMRTMHNVTTVYSITAPDGTLSSDRTPASLVKKNLLGTVVAVGWRFIDDFRINVTPEFRFTRWSSYTFRTDSTLSPRNQLEAGIAFTF